MKLSTVLGILLSALSISARASERNERVEVPRRVSLVFGFGNSVGGLGGGAEAYLANSRLSLFGGVGYVPSSRDGRGASGVAVAAGARVFTGGRRHRGFLEVAIAPAGVEIAAEGSGLRGEDILYGPAVSLGYHFVASSGFTLVVSGGVGRGMSGPDSTHGTYALATIGVGYTWRARAPGASGL